jgi:hypothetical protein
MAVAGFGGACAAADAPAQSAGYHGPYLSWAGKSEPAAPAAEPDVRPVRPDASEFAAWPAPAPGAPRLHAAPAAEPTVAPAAYMAPSPRPYVAPPHSYTPVHAYAPSHAYAPAAHPRPATEAAYAAPPAPPAHRVRPAQIAASASPVRKAHPAQLATAAPQAPVAPAQPPARALAQNDTSAPSAEAAAPAQVIAQGQPTGVHYYSLHREYGLTPDPVVTPKDRPMVLIGPPDDATPQKQDDADDTGKSAQHGGADE